MELPSTPAVVHVDLDGAKHIFAVHGWRYAFDDDVMFETGCESALELFARARIRATFFVIAEDLHNPRKRAWISRIADAGHELASHTMTHRWLTRLSAEERRREISESRDRIEQAFGMRVQGFRAPGYRIDRECLALIRDAGYEWDSSMLAGHELDGLTMPDGIQELRVPTRPPGARPFHPSYSLVLGEWFFRGGLAHWRRTTLPFVLMFHLTDFGAPLPSTHARGWRPRLFTLSHIPAERKRAHCESVLSSVREAYEIVPTNELIRDLETADS